ncbi:hypothetical protein CDAR_168341 [Caerostris darwini]|uniref:Uncharacterized protein n=1 Tax=Caerostris darwini TaxID=1538125 RepID=A0AAV4T5I9_9ARAC|nr:hypothetical protein CDAR_168341 [Caerostris darwini]
MMQRVCAAERNSLAARQRAPASEIEKSPSKNHRPQHLQTKDSQAVQVPPIARSRKLGAVSGHGFVCSEISRKFTPNLALTSNTLLLFSSVVALSETRTHQKSIMYHTNGLGCWGPSKGCPEFNSFPQSLLNSFLWALKTSSGARNEFYVMS